MTENESQVPDVLAEDVHPEDSDNTEAPAAEADPE